MRFVAFVVALVACVHLGLWVLLRDRSDAPNFEGQLASVSYAPYRGAADPDTAPPVTAAEIRADLKVLSPYVRALRTYSSTNGGELIPAIANEFGLRTTIGAWIEKDDKEPKEIAGCKELTRNECEMRAVINLARRNRNIDAILVGNETILRTDQSVEDLIKKIKRVKRSVPDGTQVSTGEIWSEWIKHPELVSNVDFIAAHILPYWNKIDETVAVEDTIEVYNKLRAAYPGKRVVIAEFGWPSAGYNRGAADPSRSIQATVLRDFVTRAEAQGIGYNVIEAFDVKWKYTEGGVGPYWGLFDATRAPKFFWTGPITNAEHWKLATLAILIGVLLSLPVLALSGATVGQAAIRAGAAHVIGAWVATVFAYWQGHYFVVGAAFALTLGLILLVPLILIALSRLEEIAAIAFGKKPSRLIPSPSLAPASYAPKISIHIPAYCEPAEMLKATLDSVARLEYPNFECVVIINNTPDPKFWQPVEEHCRTLGERFKFVRDDKVAGFKAGALRIALAHTAPDAEIIGVIDADYVVSSNWLKDLAPVFSDPKVGLVQAPQDHRDATRSITHNAMNGEYAGFFDIGMVQRNEINAIIVHGTMCLIRREALNAAGGWSSDTICEDTDLGLTILELGWVTHYTNKRYGHGLLPDNFQQFKRQRYRWAYGGLQIVKKHWRRFLPGRSQLAPEQKREFALGWLNWLGAESIGVLVALLNLIWVPFVAVLGIAIPDKILTLPIIISFAVSLLHFLALYRLRVEIPTSQKVGAVFAAMSVQWTVARAVAIGFVKDHLPFVRTAKGGTTRKASNFPAFWEAIIGSLLIGSAIFLHATNWERVREIDLFALVLVVQALPFLASVALATLEASRANEFQTWRSLETKLAGLLPVLPRRARIAEVTVVEKQIETVQ